LSFARRQSLLGLEDELRFYHSVHYRAFPCDANPTFKPQEEVRALSTRNKLWLAVGIALVVSVVLRYIVGGVFEVGSSHIIPKAS
jgi:hypothetical protein